MNEENIVSQDGNREFQGCDPFNGQITGDVSGTITCFVGSSTSKGPKVIDSSTYEKCTQFSCKGKKDMENTTEKEMRETIKEINQDAPHQQDQLNYHKDAARTLAAGTHGSAPHLTKTVIEDEDDEMMTVVRRLTPTECSRLQGFDEGHLDCMSGDSSKYRSAGNSWAVPCAYFNIARMHIVGNKDKMVYATVCSGVEAHSQAVKNMGDEAIFFSEIEKPQSQLLATRYPNVPNCGDFTKIHFDEENGIITNSLKECEVDELPECFYHAPNVKIPFNRGELDLLSGGIPCTDVSVAGKREGMKEGSGTRSSLAFNYQKLIDDLRPTFILYENVPGIFSSNGGRDFIWFVYKMMKSGYSIAWRTLDAQYVMTDEHPRAVPQRRRRLWLVGYKGNDWRVPARIVFETKNALGDNPPERIPGKGFQMLNPDYEYVDTQPAYENNGDCCMDLFGGLLDEKKNDIRKIAMLPNLEDFGLNGNLENARSIDVIQTMNKFGTVGYCGDIFESGKEEDPDNIAEDICGKFVKVSVSDKQNNDLWNNCGLKEDSDEDSETRIEQVSKGFIGNAGVMSNGKIITMDCHEWTSGIQLSPNGYKKYVCAIESDKTLESNWGWLVDNGIVPEAYDGTVCGLSDILEEDPDAKYNLSWKACYGILKRAENRGKILPEPLKEALVTTIIESAPIVKWLSINQKKDEDRTSARKCYEEYIESTYPYDKVAEEAPSRKSQEEDDELEDEGIQNDDDESNDGGFEYQNSKKSSQNNQ